MSTLLKVDQLDKLQKIAHKARKDGAKHISAASLIRDAVDDWLANMTKYKPFAHSLPVILPVISVAH